MLTDPPFRRLRGHYDLVTKCCECGEGSLALEGVGYVFGQAVGEEDHIDPVSACSVVAAVWWLWCGGSGVVAAVKMANSPVH